MKENKDLHLVMDDSRSLSKDEISKIPKPTEEELKIREKLLAKYKKK